ncbi:HAD superfamily hydrolase (TIGR01490 family) [Pseudomonas duriflava]|uniref:HAD superfamily hydrolase (TIGR01490 family) n=1 Tax=Pseudomonas duriflava TaxID=459528 RepID=A0A562QE90_9PSED|nr:HAD-IB family hydrolase [Pseudomonas duriflava]TWI54356.1 HAD superfamily hydrolase (TIGR01490 family) [Pseudomonas duriflava]
MSQSVTIDTVPVAFFDFDGTLTTGDTLMPFLKFVVGTPAYYTKLVLISPVLAAYFAKLLRNDIAKQIVLKHYLDGYQINDLFELGQRFSEEVISSMLRPKGMECLRWHQAQGHRCVLVSASIDVYLSAWAKQEGFLEVICTKLENDTDGYVSGKIRGKNCHGEEKLKRVNKWREGLGSIETFAYGDALADIPLLTSVDNGYILIRSGDFYKV